MIKKLYVYLHHYSVSFKINLTYDTTLRLNKMITANTSA